MSGGEDYGGNIFHISFVCVQIPENFVADYEEMRRELNRILIHECRRTERLRAKSEVSTRLA